MILDTDTISYFLRGDRSVKEKMYFYYDELASTTVNYAELIYGLRKKRKDGYVKNVEMLFDHLILYPFDRKAAAYFGDLKATMRTEGIVVDDMDLMIASIALVHDEVLVTNNIRHFRKIPDLMIENWHDDG